MINIANKKQKKIILATILVVVSLFIIVFVYLQRYAPQEEEPSVSEGEIITDTGEIVSLKEIEEQRRKVEEKNPLLKYLPYYNDHFLIEYNYMLPNDQAVYKITLSVSLNNPEQFERYKKEYYQYKREAIKWIEDKGIDYTKLEIIWIPEDPQNIHIED